MVFAGIGLVLHREEMNFVGFLALNGVKFKPHDPASVKGEVTVKKCKLLNVLYYLSHEIPKYIVTGETV